MWLGVGELPALGEAWLRLQRLKIPFGQRVVHREQERMIRARPAGCGIQARRIGRRRDAQGSAALRRPLRLRTAGKTGGGKCACCQRNGLASREYPSWHLLRRVLSLVRRKIRVVGEMAGNPVIGLELAPVGRLLGAKALRVRQRVRKRHPEGGIGLGTSPCSTMRRPARRFEGSGSGSADSSAWV